MPSKTSRTALWALLCTLVSSHSWVEQMSVLDEQGAYTGQPGYPRGFVPRGDPKFNDDAMTVRFPVTGRTGPNDAANRVVDSDLTCITSQASPSLQNPGYSQLTAAPGNYVALRYLENGHVSMPDNQPGKPGSGGLVYVYGTTNNKVNPKLLDVMSWKAESSLDTGRLLAVNTFDDGRCHQIRNALPSDPPPPWRNNSPQRQKDFPNGGELACETNIQIPKDAKESLTLYWVWQWPSLPGQKDASGKALGIPEGKDEIYTTCMDVKIGSVQKRTLPSLVAGNVPAANIPAAGAAQQAAGNSNPGSVYKLVGVQQPLITTAVKNYKERAANVTLPTDKAFYGPNNPGGIPRAGAAAGQAQQPAAAPAASVPAAQVPKASPAAGQAPAVPASAAVPKASPVVPAAGVQSPKASPAAPAAGGYGGSGGSSGGYGGAGSGAGGAAAKPSPANAANSPKASGFYMPSGSGASPNAGGASGNAPKPVAAVPPTVSPAAVNPAKQAPVTVMVTVTVTAPAAAKATPAAAVPAAGSAAGGASGQAAGGAAGGAAVPAAAGSQAAPGCINAQSIPPALMPFFSAVSNGIAAKQGASGSSSSASSAGAGGIIFGAARKHPRAFVGGSAASSTAES